MGPRSSNPDRYLQVTRLSIRCSQAIFTQEQRRFLCIYTETLVFGKEKDIHHALIDCVYGLSLEKR